MTYSLIAAIGRINRAIALLVGLALIGCVILVLIDIILRKLGISFGGSDEISGYVMAGTASWWMAFTLSELAHVRIDLIRLRLRAGGRAMMDILAIVVLAATAIVIAIQCWPVLAKTIARGSHANTPLETPMWIPQLIWLSGWIWFAVCSSMLALLALALIWQRDLKQADALIGTRSEMEWEP